METEDLLEILDMCTRMEQNMLEDTDIETAFPNLVLLKILEYGETVSK